jgi:hypothetical protein
LGLVNEALTPATLYMLQKRQQRKMSRRK